MIETCTRKRKLESVTLSHSQHYPISLIAVRKAKSIAWHSSCNWFCLPRDVLTEVFQGQGTTISVIANVLLRNITMLDNKYKNRWVIIAHIWRSTSILTIIWENNTVILKLPFRRFFFRKINWISQNDQANNKWSLIFVTSFWVYLSVCYIYEKNVICI